MDPVLDLVNTEWRKRSQTLEDGYIALGALIGDLILAIHENRERQEKAFAVLTLGVIALIRRLEIRSVSNSIPPFDIQLLKNPDFLRADEIIQKLMKIVKTARGS